MRGKLIRGAIVAGIALGALVPALSASANPANGTAKNSVTSPMGVGERTTQVTIHNNTSCGLKAVESGLDHGQWYAWGLSPFVYRNNQATFGTYSDGLATGVEGHATYQTYDCYDGAKNNRIVKVYWDNPYVGSNAYNTDGTDGAFSGSYSGGSGNHAYVDFWFSDK